MRLLFPHRRTIPFQVVPLFSSPSLSVRLWAWEYPQVSHSLAAVNGSLPMVPVQVPARGGFNIRGRHCWDCLECSRGVCALKRRDVSRSGKCSISLCCILCSVSQQPLYWNRLHHSVSFSLSVSPQCRRRTPKEAISQTIAN
jgi:hypothetical protein